jgi:hypothetical protein
MEFIHPAAQVGFFRGMGMQAGILPPPPSALASDVERLQQIRWRETVSRAPVGFGMRFALPAATGAIGGGIGAAMGAWGGPIGMIAGSVVGSAVGEYAYGQFAAGRDRALLLESLGAPRDRALQMGREAQDIFSEARFTDVNLNEFQSFFNQQAFTRQMAPQSQQDVKKGLQQLREDLRAVTEIRAGLNTTFEEAAQIFGGMQAAGVPTGGTPGGPEVGAPGTVRNVVARTRALRTYGFLPQQAREAAFADIQMAQQGLMAGMEGGGLLEFAGGMQMRAGELFRYARRGDAPIFEGLERFLPSPEIATRALERGGRALGQLGIVQQAAMAAQLDLPEGERSDATAVLGQMRSLMARGPGAINAAVQRAQQEMGQDFGGAVIEAQGRVGSVIEGMLREPGAGLQAFEMMRQSMGASMGREMSAGQAGQVLQAMGLDPQAVKAVVAEWTQALERGAGDIEKGIERISKSHTKRAEQQEQEIEENERRKADSLTGQIGAAARKTGGFFAGIGSDVAEFFERQNEILGKGLFGRTLPEGGREEGFLDKLMLAPSRGFGWGRDEMPEAPPTIEETLTPELRETVEASLQRREGQEKGGDIAKLVKLGFSPEEARKRVEAKREIRIRRAAELYEQGHGGFLGIGSSVEESVQKAISENPAYDAGVMDASQGTTVMIRQALQHAGEATTEASADVTLHRVMRRLAGKKGVQEGEAELQERLKDPNASDMETLHWFVSEFASTARTVFEEMARKDTGNKPKASTPGGD